VARFIEENGLVVLLKACRLLKESGYPFHCRIIGGPELPSYMDYYLTLKKLHRALALEDRVVLTGPLPFPRLLTYYNAADIFVLPCVASQNGTRDIFPRALIEAMAMKRPVIATTISAIPEIVEDGVSGLLVAPNDPAALAHAVARLAPDPYLRRRLGEHGRRKVERQFNLINNVREFANAFERRLSSPSSQRRAFEFCEQR
jgi:glycosyltransferase involved in cell wall biosynthesis